MCTCTPHDALLPVLSKLYHADWIVQSENALCQAERTCPHHCRLQDAASVLNVNFSCLEKDSKPQMFLLAQQPGSLPIAEQLLCILFAGDVVSLLSLAMSSVQGRVTDHRIGLTEHGMQAMLHGSSLHSFIYALQQHHKQDLLAGLK